MKGYWIVRVDISDPEAYKADVDACGEGFGSLGAYLLLRGGQYEAVEGGSRGRNVVIEFKDYATALACYRSPEYTAACRLRASAATADIIVIEGYDGPQPR